ncbi:hypothetical protein KSF_087580 [Reticulibacter mediterranei]|uniref:Uncharacterized protein n=1 Tax=Reticulibacter mediterranei TaxID=2778369 RepID=A0A8J3N7P9_9CHLR|nr:hypothetical protein KSF_087580 [Reticulibacter mediterranei]
MLPGFTPKIERQKKLIRLVFPDEIDQLLPIQFNLVILLPPDLVARADIEM